MNTARTIRHELSEQPAAACELRRVILSGPAGERVGEVRLEPCAPEARFRARDAAARVLVATSPNWLDRPSTGDAVRVVVGKRACFGYVADIDSVTWFSHPRLARADAFSSLPEREVRTLLYNLHAGDPDTVSEIIWETSGRIFAHRVPALLMGSDPGSRGVLERLPGGAAYWSAIARIMAHVRQGAAPVIPVRRRSVASVCPHHVARVATAGAAIGTA